MKKCPHYLEYTWGEPPLEPDENGQLHKEFECKLAKHNFIAAECEGDITKCNLPDCLYGLLKEHRAKEKELETEIKQLQAVRETAENICKLEEQKDQPHLAHQGQGMDGFTLLVEYRDRTEKLRQVLAKRDNEFTDSNGHIQSIVKHNCAICGKEIPINHVCLYNHKKKEFICMGCEGKAKEESEKQ